MYKNIVEQFLYEALIAVGRKLLQIEAHLRPCEISMLCFFKKTVNYEWTLPILEKIASQIFHRVRNIHQSVNQSINQWINIFFLLIAYITEQKMFYIKDFFSKCDQIHRKLRIWSHLLKKYLIENFIFCAVRAVSKCCKTSVVSVSQLSFCKREPKSLNSSFSGCVLKKDIRAKKSISFC